LLAFEKETIMKKLALLAVVLMGASAFAQKTEKAPKPDPWAGTWKLDVAKSKMRGPAPKEETVTSSGAAGDIVKYSISGVAADGKPINESYDGKADGQPYPFIVNGQEVAKISYHRDSDHQYSTHGTVADGSTSAGTVTLSKNGKTLTIQEHVKATQGEFDQTIVYNKQ
jgi:hypothetical protein